jgi:PBP1b-binding outer membrane lipoprotein LpoB
MGMGMHGEMMEQMMPATSDRVQSVNMGQAIDEMIEEAVADISSQNFEISSIAVWRIKSHTAGLDVEMIRRKLISRLVVLNRFKVLSRERLEEVLEEQSLSLSGAIDERSAVDIGQLIGVEGFIDGYASIEDNRFMLNLNLVETKSGVIVWAKIIGRDVQ